MSDDKRWQDPMEPHVREAAKWLARLQDPTLPPQLLRWHEWRKSARNREAFDSLASLWHTIHSSCDRLNTISDARSSHAPLHERSPANPRPPEWSSVNEDSARISPPRLSERWFALLRRDKRPRSAP
jgi:ferric-dicitrate binding protein FerR (iron transport regulator)